MSEIFWLKLKLCFHQRWDGGVGVEQASSILQIQVTIKIILLLWTSFDYQRLNKNWCSFFLPYSCSWQSRVIKKKKGGSQRALKECQWYCLPPAVCEVLKDPGDEWVYGWGGGEQNLIIMFSNPD